MEKVLLIEFRVKVFAPDGPCSDALMDVALRLARQAAQHVIPGDILSGYIGSGCDLSDAGFTAECAEVKDD
jgi:hypothetical protein